MKLQKIQQKIVSQKGLVLFGTTSLTLIILSKVYNTLITFRVVTEEYAWLAFNLIQLIEAIILPTISFIICDRKKQNLRAILLAIIIFNTCAFLQYLLAYLHPQYYFTTLAIFIAFVIPFLYRYIVESLHPTSDVYLQGGCYLAYKRPSSITGSLCALLTAPYGHCSLIVGNREFLYQRGVVVERDAELTNKLTFRKIDIVNIEEARKLVDIRWSLKNNCFATFSCFKGNESI